MERNIRIAYIVLCHKNATQVNRLINSLKNENTDFYIHIDKKVFKHLRKNLQEDEQITILLEDESVDVSWGHVSMVYAVLAAIRRIMNSPKVYDYVWLISGQDFPIKSTAEINKTLQNDECYIQMKKNQNWNKRNDLYWPTWLINRTKFAKILRRFYVEITGGYSRTFNICKREELKQEIEQQKHFFWEQHKK